MKNSVNLINIFEYIFITCLKILIVTSHSHLRLATLGLPLPPIKMSNIYPKLGAVFKRYRLDILFRNVDGLNCSVM